jgi:hypothetical protein
MGLSIGSFPYRLREKVCPHCNNDYEGSPSSGMCPRCRDGEPGREAKRKHSRAYNQRQKAARAALREAKA